MSKSNRPFRNHTNRHLLEVLVKALVELDDRGYSFEGQSDDHDMEVSLLGFGAMREQSPGVYVSFSHLVWNEDKLREGTECEHGANKETCLRCNSYSAL